MSAVSFRQMMMLEPHGPDTFIGTGPRYPWGGLYGGQIIAQALRAAALTVEANYLPHSLHGYFIRQGDASEPVRFEVDRVRNGRSFLTRRVVVRQAVGAILTMAASFHAPDEGADVQTDEMPPVETASALVEDSWSGLFHRRSLREDIAPGRVGAWLRMTEDLGDDVILNACALAFLSDDLPTEAVVARHPLRPPRDSAQRTFWNASLDHAIWFRHPVAAHDWQLHDFTCRGLINTRGTSMGSVFDATGRHVATIAQEVLIRPARQSGA